MSAPPSRPAPSRGPARVARAAATVLIVVTGVGAAGLAGIIGSFVCWKEAASYCAAAQRGWMHLAVAALTAAAVGVAWLWRLHATRAKLITSALAAMFALTGVWFVVDGGGRERPTVVAEVQVVDAEQVCWSPVGRAPPTDAPRPLPARLQEAPRCAPLDVAHDDALAPGQTVEVNLLRARHTQSWQVTSVRVPPGTKH